MAIGFFRDHAYRSQNNLDRRPADILGYSASTMTGFPVIYDRIRESMRKYKNDSVYEVLLSRECHLVAHHPDEWGQPPRR